MATFWSRIQDQALDASRSGQNLGILGLDPGTSELDLETSKPDPRTSEDSKLDPGTLGLNPGDSRLDPGTVGVDFVFSELDRRDWLQTWLAAGEGARAQFTWRHDLANRLAAFFRLSNDLRDHDFAKKSGWRLLSEGYVCRGNP